MQVLADDIELVQRLRKGDKNAFDHFYWKYHEGIYRNVLKLTRDQTSAEEIVQETFVSLWEKRNSLAADKSIAGWLFTVSYNRTVSRLRAAVREAEHLMVIQSLNSEIPMDDVMKKEAQWELLEEAVSQLSVQKRRVFELCKMQGKTYEQTAAEMGISKYTVKEYLSDAVANIKQYVQQHKAQHAFILTTGFLEIFLS